MTHTHKLVKILDLCWIRDLLGGFVTKMESVRDVVPCLLEFFTYKQIFLLSSGISLLAILIITCVSIFHGFALLIAYYGGIVFFQFIIPSKDTVPNLLFMLKRKQSIVSRSEVPRCCAICGDSRCKRHKADFNVYNLQPWAEIAMPQEIDEALEKLLNTTLDKHVCSWYKLITNDEYFIHEFRICLRFMLAILIRRSMKVDLTNLIINRMLRAAIQHLDCCLQAQRITTNVNSVEENVINYYGSHLHIAMRNRKNELKYLRHLSQNLLPFIFPKKYLRCKSLRTLIPEIVSSTVLLNAMDTLADPHMMNKLLIILFDKTESTNFDETTRPSVELLANFVESKTPTRSSTLNLPMSKILSNQTLLYPFMQFMKEESAINVLQFCLAVEDFNRKILDPDLRSGQLKALQKEAQQIYDTFCSPDAVDRVQLDKNSVEEIRIIVYGPIEGITKLRSRPPLFKCYDQAFRLLEKTFWPLFHQSDSYFTLLCGSRLTESSGRASGRSPKKELSAVSKIGNKLTKIKDVFKTSNIDNRALDDLFDQNFDISEEIAVCEMGIGDTASVDSDSLRSKDMSAWRLSIPKLNTVLEGGYKLTYVYVIEIQSIDFKKDDDPSSQHWQVERRYHEFYVLEAKLIEFHGELDDIYLPPKRGYTGKGFDFMDSRRKLFEEFLQKLLSIPNFRNSELLYRFLTPGDEFTSALFPDISFGKMFKTMPMKLLKEKGQHLDPFLLSFIQSTETIKPRVSRVESREITEPEKLDFLNNLTSSALYQNNANITGDCVVRDTSRPRLELDLESVYDYVIYLCVRVFDIPRWLLQILLALRTALENTFEMFISWYLDTKLEKAFLPQRLANLIDLFRGSNECKHTWEAIFEDQSPPPTDSTRKQTEEEALAAIRDSFISQLIKIIGDDKFNAGTQSIFTFLQCPKLNKQLSYVILDIFITELFPELSWPV
uniref:PX domain-containing protein n=1 Tax=Strigamia maritima TaxID=126957 RepID=T1IH03_STRMM